MPLADQPPPVTLLVVDDEAAIRASLRRLLSPEGFRILEAANGKEAMALVAASQGLPLPAGTGLPEHAPTPVGRIDVILSDVRMPEATGMELLGYVRQHAPGIEVILLTAYGEVSDAVAALRLGAYNFLEKPFEPDELLLEVRRAQLLVLARNHADRQGGTSDAVMRLVGESASMRELRAVVERVARTDSTVLVLGESGTGKELVARAVHDASPRASGPYVAVHCGAIPETLIESELFGHVKGAFTGATANRGGRFAQAEGGTIFLDEIGEMPLSMQVKLLRVLQEKSWTPVGGTKLVRGDFRVVAATHRDLAALVREGTFRQDLYYRLNVVPVEVPPLRDRTGDLEALCAAFVEERNRQQGTTLGPPDEAALAALTRYQWPGNVRELEHLIERISVFKPDGPITVADLPSVMREQDASAGMPTSRAPAGMNLNEELHRLEVELIRRALTHSRGNRNRAAQQLGLNRTTLVEKIKRLGVEVEPELDGAAEA